MSSNNIIIGGDLRHHLLAMRSGDTLEIESGIDYSVFVERRDYQMFKISTWENGVTLISDYGLYNLDDTLEILDQIR